MRRARTHKALAIKKRGCLSIQKKMSVQKMRIVGSIESVCMALRFVVKELMAKKVIANKKIQ